MEANNLNLAPVIMAGGAGTRFWPVSTDHKPKQFLTLFGTRSLLQQSFDRIAELASPERILVLTNSRFVHYIREQLPEIPESNIIGEPLRRDTAAAITLAALLAQKKFGKAVLAILTSDHIIEPRASFHQAILAAARRASKEQVIYTFGITPTYAASSYGYLELGEKLAQEQGVSHFKLLSFKEKPDPATAQKYLAQGNYCWNSGMFIATVDTLLEQIGKFLPEHLDRLSHAVEFYGSANWEAKLAEGLEPLTPISIDFGVMEKAGHLCCAVPDFSWKDMGGWLALQDYLAKDDAQNYHRGQLHVLDATGNLVFCEDSEETVALIGVDDLVIVRAGKTTLIVERQRSEDIKKLVKSLK